MEIGSIRHKALRRFAETGKPAGLMEVDRLRRMLAFIASAESLDELAVPPNFGFHPLNGDREGYFAMTVTRNWRLTFTMFDELTVADLGVDAVDHLDRRPRTGGVGLLDVAQAD
mgnify:CR=1 FL=1